MARNKEVMRHAAFVAQRALVLRVCQRPQLLGECSFATATVVAAGSSQLSGDPVPTATIAGRMQFQPVRNTIIASMRFRRCTRGTASLESAACLSSFNCTNPSVVSSLNCTIACVGPESTRYIEALRRRSCTS